MRISKIRIQIKDAERALETEIRLFNGHKVDMATANCFQDYSVRVVCAEKLRISKERARVHLESLGIVYNQFPEFITPVEAGRRLTNYGRFNRFYRA